MSAVAGAIVLGGCDSPKTGGAGEGRTIEPGPALATPGAVIRMEMTSRVGVLLDEIPEGNLRELAANEAMVAARSTWHERAVRQVRLTYYRLMYRSVFYPSGPGNPPKGPLPLPADVSRWRIQIVGQPLRQTWDGHDAVVMNYRFEAYLLSDLDSPGVVEPALADVGGLWDENFKLPLDTDSLLERTGYACMDEREYPPDSVFEENTAYFYDDSCEVETKSATTCHVTELPGESCAEALDAHTGRVDTTMRFSRIPYTAAIAGAARTGARTSASGADLAVIEDDLAREHAILYRYFEPGSCEMQEGVIDAPGWRRLLTFSASIRNSGAQPIDMADVQDPQSPWGASRVFEYSECHHHYHFSHYGTFGYGEAVTAKRAFCLQDTNRYHNDELTPLMPLHQSCRFQGITPGWGDEYQFGIPGQWVDITGVDTSSPRALTFDLNPDGFLCEGVPQLDAAGQLVFEPTAFTDAEGNTVSRLRCLFTPGWDINNHGEAMVASAGGSFVMEPCRRGQTGPLRSCGFDPAATLATCAAGEPVSLRCVSSGGPRVLRVCERSEALGTGVACTVRDATVNVIVPPDGADVGFDCPAVRDAAEAGTGGYATYQAPLVTSQGLGDITCVVQ